MNVHAGARPTVSLWPLMFETFVCTLALLSFVALIGPLARAVGLAEWQVGAAMAIGGVTWVVCARRWGAASDRSGRRRILLLGLAGFVLAHAALCGFIAWCLEARPPAWLVFTGVLVLRGIAGGFYAAVPATAGAFVADHFEPRGRAGALAMLGAASAAGMVAGPGVAGLLASHSLVLPLYVTSALPALALAILWLFLPRTERHAPPTEAHPEPMPFSDRRLRRPLAITFSAIACVTVAQLAVSFFAIDRLALTGVDAARVSGIALTGVGVALIAAQVLVRWLPWPPPRFIRLGAWTAAVGFGVVAFAGTAPWLWTGYFVIAAGMGWLFPSLAALAANAVGPQEQGRASGALGSVTGLGMIVGPAIGMAAYAIDPGLPYGLMALVMAWAGIWPRHRV